MPKILLDSPEGKKIVRSKDFKMWRADNWYEEVDLAQWMIDEYKEITFQVCGLEGTCSMVEVCDVASDEFSKRVDEFVEAIRDDSNVKRSSAVIYNSNTRLPVRGKKWIKMVYTYEGNQGKVYTYMIDAKGK